MKPTLYLYSEKGKFDADKKGERHMPKQDAVTAAIAQITCASAETGRFITNAWTESTAKN